MNTANNVCQSRIFRSRLHGLFHPHAEGGVADFSPDVKAPLLPAEMLDTKEACMLAFRAFFSAFLMTNTSLCGTGQPSSFRHLEQGIFSLQIARNP